MIGIQKGLVRATYGVLSLIFCTTFLANAPSPNFPLEGEVISIKNGDTTHVENARVFLIGIPPEMGYSKEKDRRLMDQVNQTFTPHVLPTSRGRQITFKNSDASNHNVRLVPEQNDTTLMNKMTYPGQSVTYTFSKKGIVHVRCDIHPNMHAYIPVVGGPFLLSRSDVDGSFSFHLPDSLKGRQVTVKGWSEQFGWSGKRKVEMAPSTSKKALQLTFHSD